jgi:hypothetical protein
MNPQQRNELAIGSSVTGRNEQQSLYRGSAVPGLIRRFRDSFILRDQADSFHVYLYNIAGSSHISPAAAPASGLPFHRIGGDRQGSGMERIILVPLRLMERIIPPLLLGRLLWPMAALWSLWELFHSRPTFRLFRRLPPALRPAWRSCLWPTRVWRRRCWLNLSKLLSVWPDRLQEPRWRNRCRVNGIERFEKLYSAGRPVVLASLHFGPVYVLYLWLRARGLPAAALVGRNLQGPLTYRRRLGRQAVGERAGAGSACV